MANQPTLDSNVQAGPRQVSCEIQGEAALLHLDEGIYYGLNTVGARVWQLIQQERKLGDVRDQICQEYEVDEAQCERDILALITELRDAGLVDVKP